MLLREAIGQHRGYIFKTGGDAFYAAFGSAADAVAATLAAQQALGAEPWPGGAVIRVRMGLHTGAAELRDGDYFGPPLNRVARMMNAGHGGQTLISVATREACGESLPEGATLVSLGEFTFKDLAAAADRLPAAAPQPALDVSRAANALADAGDAPSIAVLPFVNMSRDEENEYFADGLSEELLNVLAKIRGLRVASRTSAFSFKGKDVDIADDRRSKLQRRHRARRQRAQGRQAGAHLGAARPGRRRTRTCGPRPTTASSTTSSRCRTTSRSRW